MFDIAQALGGIPVIFIRYNPDKYVTTTRMVDTEDRLQQLVQKIKDIEANWSPVVDTDASLSVAWCTYMFYDNRNSDEITRVECGI
jgi:hypothetical protein